MLFGTSLLTTLVALVAKQYSKEFPWKYHYFVILELNVFHASWEM